MPVKKSPFSPSRDGVIRLTGPLLLFLTGMMFFRFRMYLEIPAHLLLNQFVIAIGSGYIGWELARYTAITLQQQYPGLQRITTRIIYLVIALILLSHAGYLIRRLAHMILDQEVPHWPTLVDYTGATSVLIFYSTVTLGIYESAYLLGQWKKTYAEKERLLQSEWQARYDLLKARINPHFLFNSLNSLSSLIFEDPVRAEKYTDEMSKVYRYILRSNDQELVTVAEELEFIQSYCHLLETRYGDGFKLYVQVEEKFRDCLLPSLTLQLLVENSVKHNAILKDRPLYVSIRVNSEEKLEIKNNIQKKSNLVHSSGIGLKNIDAKFRMLNLPGFSIDHSDKFFIISIPLLNNSPHQ